MRRMLIKLHRDETSVHPDVESEKLTEPFRNKSTGSLVKDAKPVKRRLCKNFVRAIRESLLMSKAELARKAGLSVLTVGRIENGVDCRMDTKRKLILALGLTLADKEKVFPEDRI